MTQISSSVCVFPCSFSSLARILFPKFQLRCFVPDEEAHADVNLRTPIVKLGVLASEIELPRRKQKLSSFFKGTGWASVKESPSTAMAVSMRVPGGFGTPGVYFGDLLNRKI